MVKKIAVIFVMLIALSSLSAASSSNEIMLGLHSGYDMLVNLAEDSENNSDTSFLNSIPLKADALFYFGKSFALNTALGAVFYLEDDVEVGFSADLLAYYKLDISERIDLLMGGGMLYSVFGDKIGDGRLSISQLAIAASLRLQAELTDHLSLFGAAYIGYNVHTALVGQSGWDVESVSFDLNIMPWGVKAGASYRF